MVLVTERLPAHRFGLQKLQKKQEALWSVFHRQPQARARRNVSSSHGVSRSNPVRWRRLFAAQLDIHPRGRCGDLCCGRIGTLNEFTDAFEDNKPQAVLVGTGGTTDDIQKILEDPIAAWEGFLTVIQALFEKVVTMLQKEEKELGIE